MQTRSERTCLAVLLGFFAGVYLWNLAPALQWGDPAKLLRVAASGEVDVVGGGGHGLLILFIRILDLVIPGGVEVAARYASPIFALASLAVLWTVLARFEIGLQGRVLGVSSLGISHLFWSVTEILESYALLALLMSLWLLAAQSYHRRSTPGRALGLIAVLAVGALNHQLMFLLFPIQLVYFAVTLRERRRRQWLELHGAGAALGVAGVMVFPEAAQAFLESVGYHVERWVDPGQLLKQLVLLPVVMLVQFPGVGFLCGAFGLGAALRWKQAPLRGLLILAMGAIASFALSYGVGRGVYLMLPVYVIFSVFIAWGWQAWVARRAVPSSIFGVALVLCVVVPVGGYALSWRVCNQFDIHPVSSRAIAYRDVNRYYLWPGKRGEDGPRRFVDALHGLQIPGALVLADFRIASVLQAAQVLERRTDGARGRAEVAAYEVANTDQLAFLTAEEIRVRLRGLIETAHENGRPVVLADPKSVEFSTRNQGLVDLLPELERDYVVETVGIFRAIRPRP